MLVGLGLLLLLLLAPPGGDAVAGADVVDGSADPWLSVGGTTAVVAAAAAVLPKASVVGWGAGVVDAAMTVPLASVAGGVVVPESSPGAVVLALASPGAAVVVVGSAMESETLRAGGGGTGSPGGSVVLPVAGTAVAVPSPGAVVEVVALSPGVPLVVGTDAVVSEAAPVTVAVAAVSFARVVEAGAVDALAPLALVAVAAPVRVHSGIAVVVGRTGGAGVRGGSLGPTWHGAVALWVLLAASKGCSPCALGAKRHPHT